MKPEQQQEQSSSISPAQTFNLLLIVIGAHRLCILPFIRRDFGPRAFGFPGLMAAVMILVFGALAKTPYMINFLYVWLAFVIVQRIRTAVKVKRGWVVHSQYQGVPWLAMKFPFMKTEAKARGLEPLLCLVVGIALLPVSKEVGAFVMLGFISLLVYMGIEKSMMDARRRNMRDARIEQQVIADGLRGE